MPPSMDSMDITDLARQIELSNANHTGADNELMDDDHPEPSKPRYFVRQIYENAFFDDPVTDEALFYVINEFSKSKPATYEFFMQSAKSNHSIRSSWRLVLVDVLIGIEFAKQAEDQDFFEATLPLLFVLRRTPGQEAIIDAVLARYGHTLLPDRLSLLRRTLLGIAD